MLIFDMKNDSKVLIQFGNNLKKIRLLKGLTQEALALDIGFDRTYISLLERGKRNPSLLTLYRIAEYLKVEVRELI
jgi:transcriptional regulator with XRE-family HTH domain